MGVIEAGFPVASEGDFVAVLLRMTREAVRLARTLTEDVEFSAGHATRSDLSHLCEVFAAAVEAGACTVNGIGECAGNAALEEVVMALRVRSDRLPYACGVRSESIYPTSRGRGSGARSSRASRATTPRLR